MPNDRYIPIFNASAFNNDQSVVSYLNALIRGGVCCGYEKINNVDNTDINGLTVPTAAVTALIAVEANAGQVNNNAVIRFREDGGNPTVTDGIPIGNAGTYEVKNEENLAGFKFISPENLVQTVHVLYYK